MKLLKSYLSFYFLGLFSFSIFSYPITKIQESNFKFVELIPKNNQKNEQNADKEFQHYFNKNYTQFQVSQKSHFFNYLLQKLGEAQRREVEVKASRVNTKSPPDSSGEKNENSFPNIYIEMTDSKMLFYDK